MKILTVDVGTGTQDIFLYDSRLDIENCFKLILPSPTMIVHNRIGRATAARRPILLDGYLMGGGPSAWAAERHAREGLPVYATPGAARTLDDDLEAVKSLGVEIVSEDEARALPPSVERHLFGDFDFAAIARAFGSLGVELTDLDAVAVAVFDHGAAPSGVSDRQFRFEYLDRRIREQNALSAFAYLSDRVPAFLTRLQAVADSAKSLQCPLVVMDTAPAAVLGARLDPVVASLRRALIVNIGNFHVLAFRLGPTGIEGLFEHHTGEIDLPKLSDLIGALAAGTLTNEQVFSDMGHGALVYQAELLPLGTGEFDVSVTGPRRSLFRAPAEAGGNRGAHLRPYFAVPFGDMMLAGCFGLLAATAEVLPEVSAMIRASLEPSQGSGNRRAPWDAG